MATYLTPGVYVQEISSGSAPIVGVGTSTAGFIGVFASSIPKKTYIPKPVEGVDLNKAPASAEETKGEQAVEQPQERHSYTITAVDLDKDTLNNPQLCTNFNEFKRFIFGKNFETNFIDKGLAINGFPTDVPSPGAKVDEAQTSLCNLIHAVYGFFSNGGTRCYVTLTTEKDMKSALEKFDAIEEIAIVAAPGSSIEAQQQPIDHCQNGANQGNSYRFAIIDSAQNSTLDNISTSKPKNSDYAAFYYPWIAVFDPAAKIMHPNDKTKWQRFVPPSGHIAGLYARVDDQRGVHKAPANEVLFGALGLERSISKVTQGDLNSKGINCIRDINGNIRVWGARTVGGDANGEFKYINIRRLFLYLRHSIDQGTQWAVFEPNSPELWAKIRRNVTAFLTNVWRTGALFGNTPEEAFYVKCDAENNPIELREIGQVNIEIGVAVVQPAEFVIFRLSQWAGTGS